MTDEKPLSDQPTREKLILKTVDDVLNNDPRPCRGYTRKRLEKLWGKRKRLSIRSILRLPIPDKDKVWAAFQLQGALTDDQRDRAVELIVTRAVTNHALHCGIAKVEAWAARWLSGEDRSRDAASAAAWAAAWAASDAATWAAASAAAAWAAARDAAWDAAWAAAWDAERYLQVKDILEVTE